MHTLKIELGISSEMAVHDQSFKVPADGTTVFVCWTAAGRGRLTCPRRPEMRNAVCKVPGQLLNPLPPVVEMVVRMCLVQVRQILGEKPDKRKRSFRIKRGSSNAINLSLPRLK